MELECFEEKEENMIELIQLSPGRWYDIEH